MIDQAFGRLDPHLSIACLASDCDLAGLLKPHGHYGEELANKTITLCLFSLCQDAMVIRCCHEPAHSHDYRPQSSPSFFERIAE